MNRRQFLESLVIILGAVACSHTDLRQSSASYNEDWAQYLRSTLSEAEINAEKENLRSPGYLKSPELEKKIETQFLDHQTIYLSGWVLSRSEAAIVYLKLISKA